MYIDFCQRKRLGNRNRQCNSNRSRMVDKGFEGMEWQSLLKRKPAETSAHHGRLERVMGRNPSRNQRQSSGLLGLSYIQTEFKRKRINSCVTNFKEFVTFSKEQNYSSVDRLCDNMCFYKFSRGSIKILDVIARNTWDLAIRNNINLQAKHLRGIFNYEADRLSRLPAQYEWHIHRDLFKFIDKMFGPHTVDRFGSILIRQLPRYNSLYWDPETEGVDALSQSNWQSEINFVNPPFRLLPKVIDHVCATNAEATVVAPYWPAKTWFYKLKKIAICPPLRLPKPRKMCIGHLNTLPEPLKNPRWKLYAWRVSGQTIL